MIKTNSKLIIWDKKKLPKTTSDEIFLWNTRSNKFNSLINYIDNNSKQLKKNTLDLFVNFGNSKINNINIKDYYNLEKNFSYWNLSFFLEKNFYKQNFLNW